MQVIIYWCVIYFSKQFKRIFAQIVSITHHPIMSSQTIELKDVESQTTTLVNQSNTREELYAKLCLSATTTIVLAPFAICDTYYAVSDDACMNQNSHNLSLTLHSYLLANGIITFVFLGGINLGIFACDLKSDNFSNWKTELEICGVTLEYIMKLFGTSWLITGCVLFWAYTNMALCSKSSNDYLFARFILGIIFHVAGMKTSSNRE